VRGILPGNLGLIKVVPRIATRYVTSYQDHMKPGPKPLGERPMTGAERQARYRAARAESAPVVRYRKPKDRRSRTRRWTDAVGELVVIQAECQVWLDGLPESLAHSAVAEALREVCSYDFTELEALQPPRGYGRDYN